MSSASGQASNSWNIAASWTNGALAFPNAAGDIARTTTYIDGNITLYLNQDINLGTVNWSSRSLLIYPGGPSGKLIFDNSGLPGTWRISTPNGFWLEANLVLNDSLTLSNAVDYGEAEPVRLSGVISGPGRLTLHWSGFANYPFYIGVQSASLENSYSGGTRLEGHSSNGGNFEPRKNGAFGLGDVELNGYAKLVLRDRGPMDNYIVDSAALRLETINITNRSSVYLGSNVNEVVSKLYLDGVEQPGGTYGATGSGATELLDDFFTGPGILTVTSGATNAGALRNLPPSNVAATSSTLAGEVLATNTSAASTYIFWGFTDGGRQPSAWSQGVSLGDIGPGVFSISVSNYPAGQTMYYRCYLTNVLGGKWADRSVRFGPPNIQTNLPLVRSNFVTLRSTVLSTNALPTQAAVFWGTNDGGTVMNNWQNSMVLGMVGEGMLMTNVYGLLPNTRYFYRFYLTNAASSMWAASSTSFTMPSPPVYGEITFFAGSDSHYGAVPYRANFTDQITRNSLDNMNSLAGQPYPTSVGGGAVGLPRGALLIGDLTDSATQSQWTSLTNDWGLNGERVFSFPVYEAFGNHDFNASKFVLERIKARNPLRSGIGNISANGYHYSFDWDFLHVVCLNLFPGNEAGAYGLDPQGSLQFLMDDLATNVGTSRRPVLLYHHYGLDPLGAPWWTPQQQTNYFDAIKNYNVIAILTGHNHGADFINWRGLDTCIDGTLGQWSGNFIAARVTLTNLLLLERTSNNTWGRSFSKPIWVPGTLSVSNSEGATMLTFDSARLNGQLITPNPPPASVAIYWGPTDGGTNESAWANAIRWNANNLGALHADISGLTENTTYFYRCYASNASGQAWAPLSAHFKTRTDFSSWQARMKSTFSGYNGEETLTNFPVLIVLSTNRTGFAYDQFASPVANDLRFSDENGFELNYEIDEWNTNGSSYVWVQLPQLTGANTAIWTYWKNAAAATSPPSYSTNGATWSEGYIGVWHMKEADALNSVNGTIGMGHGNSNSEGLIGGAQNFTRATANQYVDVGNLNTTNLTMEAWTRGNNANPPGGKRVLEKASSYRWEKTDTGNNLKLAVINDPTQYDYGQDGNNELGDPAWNYESITYDAATSEARGSMNGVYKYIQNRGAGIAPGQNSSPTTISSASLGYDGQLDEVRLSRVVRSTDWIHACFDTVINRESFSQSEPVLLNTPPVLSPIPDQTVTAGDMLIVSNVVTDAESPPQILTFSLLDAPTGAVLDTSRGVFTWRPGFAEIDTTNLIAWKVTDSGTPMRSVELSFRVTVKPPLLPMPGAVGWTNGQWAMGIWGPINREYTIQSSTNLRNWVTLCVTNPPALPFRWIDTNAASFRARFYRVRLGP